ncbi:hypothetical protein T484DRAFT_1752875 [Baffinella frigidus]|nr:hypothetical protein T484DRAFT_1752875 [Cryptophyta sp. CCMP2293]
MADIPVGATMPNADMGNNGGGLTMGSSMIPAQKDYEGIFGPTGRDVKLDDQRNKRHQRWHLPDMLKGPNPFLTDRIDGLITDATNSPFTTIILPYVYLQNPDAKIKWNVFNFDEGLATRVPYESGARVLTQTKTSHAGYAVRQGLAITMEHNFMMSPAGRENFHNQLLQLVGSIQHTNDLDVHMALITAPSYERTVAEKYHYLDKDGGQVIRQYVDMFGIMQKNPNGLDVIIEEAKQNLKKWGSKDPTFMLVNSRLCMQLNMNVERTQYYTNGYDGVRRLKQGPDMPKYRGLDVINSRSFALETGAPPRDLLNRRVRVAEYYHLPRVTCTDFGKGHVDLYDEGRDQLTAVSLKEIYSVASQKGGAYLPSIDAMQKEETLLTMLHNHKTHFHGSHGSVASMFDYFKMNMLTNSLSAHELMSPVGAYLVACVQIELGATNMGAASDAELKAAITGAGRVQTTVKVTEAQLLHLATFVCSVTEFAKVKPAYDNWAIVVTKSNNWFWANFRMTPEFGQINHFFHMFNKTPAVGDFDNNAKSTLALVNFFTAISTEGNAYDIMKTLIRFEEVGGACLQNCLHAIEYDIVLVRPNIEHEMLGMILGRGGTQELGCTFWGQTELSCYDDAFHGKWGMSYKYHERALIHNEKNMTRIWDVCFNGYTGGMGCQLVPWDQNHGSPANEVHREWKNRTQQLDTPIGMQGPDIMCMVFKRDEDSTDADLPNPVIFHRDRNAGTGGVPASPVDPENIYSVDTLDMHKLFDRYTDQMEEYRDIMPDFSKMHHNRKGAGMASTEGDTHTYSMAFQGTMHVHLPGKSRIVRGSGHLGESYVGIASVRAGKGMVASGPMALQRQV